MLITVFNKKNIRPLFAAAVMMLVMHPVFSQRLPKRVHDSVKVSISDSILPDLVMKVASYTATIDHTDFLIRRKFNVTPISLNMPEIERKVKGFKTRLETRGNQMNLRSLNSGVIMLNEILKKLTSYQKVLTNYSSELAKSNSERRCSVSRVQRRSCRTAGTESSKACRRQYIISLKST